jgi:3-oxoadipate enol-lactonase
VPNCQTTGVDIYYERGGAGPRLLFINGSGATIEETAMLLSIFEPSFDFLAYDNRGLGRSGPAGRPYGMADCAADALAVMDDVGWDSARVLGVSFGGMVAQELAVTAPERVERLALLCTSPGGPGRASYPLHELVGLDPEERSRRTRTLLDTRFDDEWLSTHPADQSFVRTMEDSRASGIDPGRRAGELAQFEARRSHDVWDRLPAITCPTFVACGAFDGIAPPANSEAIASRLTNVKLRTYDGGHIFFAQDPRAVPDVTQFLRTPNP